MIFYVTTGMINQIDHLSLVLTFILNRVLFYVINCSFFKIKVLFWHWGENKTKRKISFQKRLMLSYSFFTTLLLAALCIIFYLYNANLFEKNSESSLTQVVFKTSQQLDLTINEMDKLSISVMSDENFINSLIDLSDSRSQESDDLRILNTALVVKVKAIYKDNTIYRASVFNTKGDFFSSGLYDELDKSIGSKIKSLPWLEEARKRNGTKFLLPPFTDIWSSKEVKNVFSLVRIIRDPSDEIGFMEIQQDAGKLKDICDIKGENSLKILVVDEQGNRVYSNSESNDPDISYYSSIVKANKSLSVINAVSPKGISEIISFEHSDYTGWTVMAIQNKAELFSGLTMLRNIIMFLGIGIILITLLFFYIFSKQLTSPLKQLRKTMEDINIDNLPERIPVRHENDEIQALNTAFQRMRTRLNQAIEHELQSRSLQMKAQFDALQAQINPHFLYNMLGVIANMGEEAEQDRIATTCRSLAKMLRYSTSSKKAHASIGEEIEHLSNYMSLMKKRFEQRIEYTIKIDERMLDILLPKLTIQPLVENSISHGFENCPDTMKITVVGTLSEDTWQIVITDNGSGFNPNTLDDIKEKIRSYSEVFFSSEQNIELSIGGMGIISTFARLQLLYGKDIRFEITNLECGGASTVISGPILKNNSKEESPGV